MKMSTLHFFAMLVERTKIRKFSQIGSFLNHRRETEPKLKIFLEKVSKVGKVMKIWAKSVEKNFKLIPFRTTSDYCIQPFCLTKSISQK